MKNRHPLFFGFLLTVGIISLIFAGLARTFLWNEYGWTLSNIVILLWLISSAISVVVGLILFTLPPEEQLPK